MVVIFVHVLDDLDFARGIRVVHHFVGVVCDRCRCPSPVDIFCNFPRHSNLVRDLTQTSS